MGKLRAYQRCNARVLGLAALLLCLLMAAPTVASEPERFNETAWELLHAGFSGDEEALDRGMALAEQTLAADPDHTGALVWQATVWSYQSGAAFAQGDWDTGQSLFDQSLAQFDRAVAIAPDSLETRTPRASVLLSVARHTNDADTRNRYLETAAQDYAKVLELRPPGFESLTVHSRGDLLGGLAEVLWRLEKRDEAKVYLHRMIAELPESKYAILAQRQLEDPNTPAELTCFGCEEW